MMGCCEVIRASTDYIPPILSRWADSNTFRPIHIRISRFSNHDQDLEIFFLQPCGILYRHQILYLFPAFGSAR